MGHIRKKVAEAFHLPFEGFKLSSPSKSVYEPEENDMLIKDAGWTQQIFLQKYATSSNESAKSLLANNQNYISYLILLLTKETSTYVNIVWELLSNLSKNQKMYSEIFDLNLASNKKVNHKKIHK